MNKINLTAYYQGLDKKTEFVRKVAAKCGISSSAVVKWCYGDVGTKNEKYLKVLNEMTARFDKEAGVPIDGTGIPIEDLFNRDFD